MRRAARHRLSGVRPGATSRTIRWGSRHRADRYIYFTTVVARRGLSMPGRARRPKTGRYGRSADSCAAMTTTKRRRLGFGLAAYINWCKSRSVQPWRTTRFTIRLRPCLLDRISIGRNRVASSTTSGSVHGAAVHQPAPRGSDRRSRVRLRRATAPCDYTGPASVSPPALLQMPEILPAPGA